MNEAAAPGHRLRSLADYLGLDWPWLWRRCADLAEHGCDGLVPPRTRLLSTEGVDAALRYVGTLGRDTLGMLGKYGYVEQVPGSGKERPWRSISLRQDLSAPGPELKDRLDAEAATEAFLEHEFDRMHSWQRLQESELQEWWDASASAAPPPGSPPRRCDRSTTRSGRSWSATLSGWRTRRCGRLARAARVFFFTGVSPRR